MEASSTSSRNPIWAVLQIAMIGVGLTIVAALILVPKLGLHLLWDVLIPAAPLLFVLVPGFWRNVCPVSTIGMLAQRTGLSRRRKIGRRAVVRMALSGVLLLYVAVPLRHVIFDLNGMASAAFLIVAACLAFMLGMFFAWKSPWCAGLCPVRPVEALYGFRPALRFGNAHCGSCGNCSVPCPDSTAEIVLRPPDKSFAMRLMDLLLVGGFVGFIWGWFHVKDYAGVDGWQHLPEIYAWPFLSAAVTGAIYYLLLRFFPTSSHAAIRRIFACAAVSCYYWYRLPMLLGFGLFPGDGMLVDLGATLPVLAIHALQFFSTAFFLWWMVLRGQQGSSWLLRPKILTEAEQFQV
jgi:hypothetical protein